jgi:hypothetical protein
VGHPSDASHATGTSAAFMRRASRGGSETRRRGAAAGRARLPGGRNGNLTNLSPSTFDMLRAFATTSLHARKMVCPSVLYQTLIYFLFYIIF